MAWDPDATRVLVFLGGTFAFLGVVYYSKRKTINAPRPDPVYGDPEWGHVLGPSERIELQVPVAEPYAWYTRLLTGRWYGWRARTPLQLALTTGDALLLAERRWLGGLSGRERFEASTVALEEAKDLGADGVTVRLRLGKRKVRLEGVPPVVVDRLRAMSRAG